MNTTLTHREDAVLRWLARRWSYKQIAEHLKTNAEVVHTYAYQIRQKTKIHDTKDAEQCRYFLLVHKARHDYPLPHQKEPTAKQLEVMQMVAEGVSFPEIAQQLGMGLQTAQNHACQGCRRAGIFQRYRRTEAIREWLAKRHEENPALDPAFT